ncbi:MAG TPA: hypothetical protein VFK39_08215 [Gemmatimonadaceae bacterium]|nr:hypothetical protein [Gemmatimonadaceae bacterium]
MNDYGDPATRANQSVGCSNRADGLTEEAWLAGSAEDDHRRYCRAGADIVSGFVKAVEPPGHTPRHYGYLWSAE